MKNKLHIQVTKGFMAGALVFGLLTIPTGAEEQDSANTEVTATAEAQTTADPAADTESAPALVPGDIFYFVKVMVEKIQLALEFDQVEKAKMIAAFAEERISEVKVLIDQGKHELAQEVMQEAVDSQAVALDTVAEQKTADSNTEGEATDETADTSTEEVEGLVHQNIIALTKVLEKLDNPQAKAAIERNIQRSLAHLEKKSAKKLADREAEETENTEEVSTTKSESATVSNSTEPVGNTGGKEPKQDTAAVKANVEAKVETATGLAKGKENGQERSEAAKGNGKGNGQENDKKDKE
jgi:colicin import membrane protein